MTSQMQVGDWHVTAFVMCMIVRLVLAVSDKEGETNHDQSGDEATMDDNHNSRGKDASPGDTDGEMNLDHTDFSSISQDLVPVTFCAIRTTTLGPVKQDTTLLFDNITLNDGDAFDPSTSRFITPITGDYFFSYTFQSDCAILDLYLNQSKIRPNIMMKHQKQGSNFSTLLLQLTRGDYLVFKLKARGLTKTLNCAEYLCQFAGYLVAINRS